MRKLISCSGSPPKIVQLRHVKAGFKSLPFHISEKKVFVYKRAKHWKTSINTNRKKKGFPINTRGLE